MVSELFAHINGKRYTPGGPIEVSRKPEGAKLLRLPVFDAENECWRAAVELDGREREAVKPLRDREVPWVLSPEADPARGFACAVTGFDPEEPEAYHDGDVDEAYHDGDVDDAYREGYENGREDGYRQGHAAGSVVQDGKLTDVYNDGLDVGRMNGHEDGYRAGREAAEEDHAAAYGQAYRDGMAEGRRQERERAAAVLRTAQKNLQESH